METTKLSSKGQVVIPKSVRIAHCWSTGTEFTIEDYGDGIILKPRKPFPPTELAAGLGCTGYRGPPKSIAEMQQGIDDEFRRLWQKERPE